MASVAIYTKRKLNNKKYYMNAELYNEFANNGGYLPTRHMLAIPNQQMLDNDFQKMFKYIPFYPNITVLKLTEVVFTHFKHQLLGGVSKMFNVLEFSQCLQKMPKDSSPGFYYKRAFNCTTRNEVLSDEVLRQDLEQKFEDVKKGVFFPSVWEVSPKVEIRAAEKLYGSDCKMRTFMSCDMLMYIVSVSLFSEQNDHFHMMHDAGWCRVGFTQFYGGWHHRISRYMNAEHKGIVVCTDLKHQEISVFRYFQQLFIKIRSAHLNQNEATQNLLNYYTSFLINGPVADMHGKIYVKEGMNPSGGFNTLDDNSWHNEFLFLYTYISYLHKNNMQPHEIINKANNFIRNHPGDIVGDDSRMADHPAWDNLTACAAELGTILTFEDGERRKNILQSKFLNTSTIYDPQYGMYFPEPNVDKLFAGLYYYRKKNSWRLTLIRLYAMRMLFWPVKKYFNEVNQIIDYIRIKHASDLAVEPDKLSNVTMAQLDSAELSEEQIASLYTGGEANRGVCGGHNTHSTYLNSFWVLNYIKDED